jgi:hypothetical protein
MTHETPRATEEEMRTWLLLALKHSTHWEYFANLLNIGAGDPERPHDLVGPGNKLEYEVANGLALQLREPLGPWMQYVMRSRQIHRQQYHHQYGNGPDPNDPRKPHPKSTEDSMSVIALDAICSLRENRKYLGGMHTYEQITPEFFKNEPHKLPRIIEVKSLMEKQPQPRLQDITDLFTIPNIGLPERTYEAIIKRRDEAVKVLRAEHGYILKPQQ